MRQYHFQVLVVLDFQPSHVSCEFPNSTLYLAVEQLPIVCGRTSNQLSASVPRMAILLQNLVATRARFQIIHHHDAPKQQQQLVAHRSKLPTLNTAGEPRGTNKSKGSSRAPLAGAALSSRPSRSTTPKKVAIDGHDVALCHRGADGQWSAQGPLLAIQVGAFFANPDLAYLPQDPYLLPPVAFTIR